MKLFKNMFAAMLIAVSTVSTVFAAEKPVLDVIIPSGNSGASWAEGILINEALKEAGFDSEVVHTKNCANTVKYMETNPRPGIFLYKSGRYIKDKVQKDCYIDARDGFVTMFYARLQAFYSRSDDNITDLVGYLKGKDRVTIATMNTVPDNIYSELEKVTGTKIVRVDYDGSKAILQGVLSGDTDLMYDKFTTKEQNNKDLKIHATSATKTIDGLPALNTVFPSWNGATLTYAGYIHGVNLDEQGTAMAREAVLDILANNKKLNAYVTGAKMTSGVEMSNEGVDFFLNNVEMWGGITK